MCGRYTNTATRAGSIRERFDLAEEVPGEGLGRANVSPTQQVLAVVRDRDEEPRPVMLRWGLAPRWATLKGGPSLINARDDKIASSNAWKPLVRSSSHRALIVADGWIEWKHAEDPKQPKQPFLHRLKTSEIFAFAGLWTVAQPKDAAEKIASCAIITTSANTDVSFVHDRMPVVLDGIAAEAAWLDPDVDLDAALELVRPLPDGLLDVYPLSTRINSSRAEGIELLTPLHG
jgi:putative SOS response-associated peptidase YedK